MRIKPSKFMSLVCLIVCIIFTFIGLIVLIPANKQFGIIWTIGTILLGLYYAINLFTEKGFSLYVFESIDKPKRAKKRK